MILGEPLETINFCANHFHLMFFSALTIAFNGFQMVLGSLNHLHLLIFSPQTIASNGFSMVLGSINHWFSMVMDHWSKDAMVSMYCSPLNQVLTGRRLPNYSMKNIGIWYLSKILGILAKNVKGGSVKVEIFGNDKWDHCQKKTQK